MSTPVAQILAVTGEAFARDADGNMRPINVGDTLNAGEVVVTSAGASVVLSLNNGEIMEIGANQSVAMVPEMATDAIADAGEGSMMDPTAAAVLAALQGDGDLLEQLDATAAGPGAGGDAGEGGGIVMLDRVNETVNGVDYGFEPAEPGVVLLSEDVIVEDDDEIELPIVVEEPVVNEDEEEGGKEGGECVPDISFDDLPKATSHVVYLVVDEDGNFGSYKVNTGEGDHPKLPEGWTAIDYVVKVGGGNDNFVQGTGGGFLSSSGGVIAKDDLPSWAPANNDKALSPGLWGEDAPNDEDPSLVNFNDSFYMGEGGLYYTGGGESVLLVECTIE